jgi:hypothetical protein
MLVTGKPRKLSARRNKSITIKNKFQISALSNESWVAWASFHRI